MVLSLDETLLKLGLQISFMGYLKDGAPRSIEITEYNNTVFNCKVVENEFGQENYKEVVTNSEEKASKKKAQYKSKKNTARAQALFFVAVPGLSALTSASVLVLGLSAAVPGSSAPTSASVPIPGLSAAVPESSIAVLELSVAVPALSATMLGSSAPTSISVPVPGSSVSVPLSTPVFPGLSPLPFPALSLPKTPMPDLAAGRQGLDDIISR